ncbi:hypothetical protein, partial [Staphylococcus aureus]
MPKTLVKLKMNQRVKKLWIKALLSGEYLQMHGALRGVTKGDEIGYCCLGVLCDVYRKSNLSSKVKWVETDSCTFTLFREEVGLPEKVKKWSGVPSPYSFG